MTALLLWLLAVCILYAMLERDRRVAAEKRLAILQALLAAVSTLNAMRDELNAECDAMERNGWTVPTVSRN